MALANPSPIIRHEKAIFKCDRHTAIISEKLLNFYEENELFDTELITTGSNNYSSIQAHRVVLCALSEYFLEIFRGTKSISKENVVELKEIEASTLKPIIDFIYKGSIELSLKTVKGLLRTALFLKMKTLVDGCCEFIEKNINSNNSLNWYQLANELNLTKLKAKSLESIYTNFKQILKNKELLMLSASELKNLLFIENPHGNLGELVFLSMAAWINFDKSNRDHQVIELLSMVRFQTLSPKFIVKNRKSICRSVESYELICSWLQWHLLPETRSNDQPGSAIKASKKKRKKKNMKPDKLAVICRSDRQIIIKTFNPEVQSWSTKIELRSPADKRDFSMIVINNKLILVGGTSLSDNRAKSVECLNLDTSEWITFPPMNTGRSNCQLADLNGHLCAFGIEYLDHDASLEIYNFSTKKWNDLEPLTHLSPISEIACHKTMLYILDLEYCFLQSYDVSSNKWTSTKIILDLHHDYYKMRWGYFHTSFGLAATEQFLYIIGGFYVSYGGYDKRNTSDVYGYDLINNSWSEMTSLPNKFEYCKTIVCKNKIIICDGEGVAEYDPETDTWNTLGVLSVYNCDTCCLTFLK